MEDKVAVTRIIFIAFDDDSYFEEWMESIRAGKKPALIDFNNKINYSPSNLTAISI